MITADDIRARINPFNDRLGRHLLDKMEERARLEPDYKKSFQGWLIYGGTIWLRDSLAAPFKHDKSFDEVEPGRYDAWHDAWTALDSARLAVRS